jgi:hypothetical protein
MRCSVSPLFPRFDRMQVDAIDAAIDLGRAKLHELRDGRIEVGGGCETNHRLLPFLHTFTRLRRSNDQFFQSWMGFLLNRCRRYDDPESALVTYDHLVGTMGYLSGMARASRPSEAKSAGYDVAALR